MHTHLQQQQRTHFGVMNFPDKLNCIPFSAGEILYHTHTD